MSVSEPLPNSGFSGLRKQDSELVKISKETGKTGIRQRCADRALKLKEE
jgi:hypothetical protein